MTAPGLDKVARPVLVALVDLAVRLLVPFLVLPLLPGCRCSLGKLASPMLS
jgi:hypothetical protein